MLDRRGAAFDDVHVGRLAAGALIDAGYRSLADLPKDLAELLTVHGIGPAAVKRLDAARGAS